ncbi:MAG: hypothetical protein NHF87_00400 [Candidatus Shikimatogenerans bostrichidophilus]|nr:MAG: hypothetical protein NHF87_00400 [Candidatus Shikimatogenerans bostrichidophilus]
MYKKYLIYINNYSAGTKPINSIIYNYIFLLYKNESDPFYFFNILIITFYYKFSIIIIDKIIKNLKRISYNKKANLSKFLHNNIFISYKNIQKKSKILLKNILLNYDKLPIFTIEKLLNKIYYNYNINNYKNYLFKKNINYIVNKELIYFFLNNIFKNKKKKNYIYIKKFLYKKIYIGYFKITKVLKKKVKLLLNNNLKIKYINENNINKKIYNYILFKKKIRKFLYKKKEIFYSFLEKKKINKKSFIYNDIYKIFEKKINFNLLKQVYLNNRFLNKRLENNLKKNIFYSQKINLNEKIKIDKSQNKIKKIIYKYDSFIKKIALNYINYNNLIEYNIYKLLILYILKYNKKKYIYNKTKKIFNNNYINICNTYKTLFLYEYPKLTNDQWNLLKFLFYNIIYEGNNIYLWGDFKKYIYKGEDANCIKYIKNFKNIYKTHNIISKKEIRKNKVNDYFIVLFNNNLYSYIKDNYILYKKYKVIYNNSCIQLSKEKNNGYIEINILGKKNNYYKKILVNIKNILNQGYTPRDIIIMGKTQQEVNNFILNLNKNNNILNNIIFNNGLYLNDLIHVKILIQLLKCIIYKNVYKYRINFILLFNKLNNLKSIKIKKSIYKKKIKFFFSFLKKNNIYISYNILLELNFYEKVVYLIRKLHLNESILYNFLDIIYEFEKKNKNNIYHFLDYWAKNKYKYIINNNNIIKVLSINDNKDILSKIIILPLFKWNIFYNKKQCLNDIYFNKKIYKKHIDNFIIKKQIDNFNILYNLTTRAKNKLIIFLNKNDNCLNIYFLFQKFLKKINVWNKKRNKYCFGIENKKLKLKKNTNTNSLINNLKKIKLINYKKQNKYTYQYVYKKKIIKYLKTKVISKNRNKINILKLEYYYNNKIIEFNNSIIINNVFYIIKIINIKKYNINNIINNIFKKIFFLKKIYNNKYNKYYILIFYIKKDKIKYIYKIL